MADLPTGTVTLLFTDIEGSTKLLHELGERYADVLAEHRRVLRSTFQARGGIEVDTQGDAFFYAFPRAADAAAAAEEAQAALGEGPVRVRIAVHTGEPAVTEEGYVGADVHRAARIMGVGHGGQVLLSQTTRELLDASVDVRDLGEHRLKDVGAQRLYQLGAANFSPLRSLNATNLPQPPTPLLGRKKELADVLRLVLGDRARLVTLTGPGGIGKTRFALEVGAELVEHFVDGVWFVDLSPLREPALVATTVASAVGSRGPLEKHFADKELLLVVDNFEQVVEAADTVASLLSSSPNLQVVVTSREPLRVAAEREYGLRPLAESPAVELFRQRAGAANADFDASYEELVRICERLDRLPLAIELAAARVRVLSPPELLNRLERRLSLLTSRGRDLPERQRTLRAAIEWSYDLCSPEEQVVFRRLGVFAGGGSLQAAEEVCQADLDVLESLIDKSLVRRSGERIIMLETIREYALERLETSDEHEILRDRHAAYYAELADCRWGELVEGETDWREVVERELMNLHAAIEWALATKRADDALAIASGIWPFWHGRGYGVQGRRWLERALELTPEAAEPRRAHALLGFGDIARYHGDAAASVAAVEEALRLFRALDDPREASVCLSGLADLALEDGNLERARVLAEESVEMRRRAGGFALGRGLLSVAEIAFVERDYEYARAVLEESLAWFRAEWPHSQFIAGVLGLLGAIALKERDYERARELCLEAVRVAAATGDEVVIASALDGMAAARSVAGDAEGAARLAGASERLRERSDIARFRTSPSVPEQVEPAWSEGRAMTLEEAVEDALVGLD